MTLAHTLVADPTFNLMSQAEKLDEALAIMRSADPDTEPDPLEAALAVEEAEGLLSLATPSGDAPAAVSGGVEPCREDRPSCASPVAGNGRCLECGARRVVVGVEVSRPADPDPVLRPVTEVEYVDVPPMLPAKSKPRAPVLARFKAVTGNSDKDIGDMLNLARSTVQATVGGRMPEKLTPAQLSVLADVLRLQAKEAQDLAAEILS